MLVARDDGRLALGAGHLDRDDLIIEAPALDGGDRALLAVERERVLPLAASRRARD
jgi:hypothetical protein